MRFAVSIDFEQKVTRRHQCFDRNQLLLLLLRLLQHESRNTKGSRGKREPFLLLANWI
jgi:hypothetical protein